MAASTSTSRPNTMTINVTAVNDAPAVDSNHRHQRAPNISNLAISKTTISFIANDVDNATLTLARPFATAFSNRRLQVVRLQI